MSNQIELRHLRYFMALTDTLNFHKASDQLHISQPGLSRQIQQLEFHLGTPLFIRNRREVRLTEAGKHLREQLIPPLNRLENIFEQTRRIGEGETGEIRIGFLGSAMQEVIPQLLLDLRKSFPGIHTSLEELSNRSQVKALMEERLDLGFVRLADLPEELEPIPVVQETFSLVVPENHLVKQDSFRSIKQFKEDAFILFSPAYSPEYYQTVMSICEDAGFRPTVSHKSVHAHTIFKLVANGLGVAIVPTSLQFGFQLDIRFLELQNIRQRAVLNAVWKKGYRNKALDQCIEYLCLRKDSF